MKKTFLVIGFLCALSGLTVAHEHRDNLGHLVAPLLDDSDDDMSEEEVAALAALTPAKQSALQQWIVGRASTLLVWYMNYKRCVRSLARMLRKSKPHKTLA